MKDGGRHHNEAPRRDVSFIELIRSHISGGRDSKSPVPDHQVLILLVRHLRVLILACQIVVDILGDIISAPLGMLLVRVYAFDIFRKLCLDLLVIHRGLGIILPARSR